MNQHHKLRAGVLKDRQQETLHALQADLLALAEQGMNRDKGLDRPTSG